MRVRRFQESDVPRISEIWESYHTETGGLPARTGLITDLVVEDDDGKVIGYGQLHLFALAMMFMDLGIRKRDRREVMSLLLGEAIDGAASLGIEKIYTFIKDPVYARLVEKHFGFDLLGDNGELLIRRV